MAKYQYELDQKVWVIPLQDIGKIVDIKGNKYEIYIERIVSTADENKFCIDIWEEGYITCMAHELLPYTEGMELLYDI